MFEEPRWVRMSIVDKLRLIGHSRIDKLFLLCTLFGPRIRRLLAHHGDWGFS